MSEKNVCYLCGDVREYVLENHHALPVRYGGEDNNENMYYLCKTCHQAIENMYDDEFYDRFASKLGIEMSAKQRIDALNNSSKGETTGRYITDKKSKRTACKAVYDESLQSGEGNRWVPEGRAANRIRMYLSDEEHLDTLPKLWGNLIEHIPEKFLQRRAVDGGSEFKCTDIAISRFLASGSATTAGNGSHRMLLQDAYEELTKLGLRVKIPYQDNTLMPDAVGQLDAIGLLQFDSDDIDPRDIHTRVEEFEKEHPTLNRLTEAREVTIEAESKSASKPIRTLQNLAKAIKKNTRCLFVCRESTAPRIWEIIKEEPQYKSTRGTVFGHEHRLYNHTEVLKIDGEVMYRPADDEQPHTTWKHHQERDEYILAGPPLRGYCRFDTPQEIYSTAEKYPARESEIRDEDRWVPIKEPVIPKCIFGGEVPDEPPCNIIVIKDDGSYIYRDGDLFDIKEWGRESLGEEITPASSERRQRINSDNGSEEAGKRSIEERMRDLGFVDIED